MSLKEELQAIDPVVADAVTRSFFDRSIAMNAQVPDQIYTEVTSYQARYPGLNAMLDATTKVWFDSRVREMACLQPWVR